MNLLLSQRKWCKKLSKVFLFNDKLCKTTMFSLKVYSITSIFWKTSVKCTLEAMRYLCLSSFINAAFEKFDIKWNKKSRTVAKTTLIPSSIKLHSWHKFFSTRVLGWNHIYNFCVFANNCVTPKLIKTTQHRSYWL